MSARPVALTFDAFAGMCKRAESVRQPLPTHVQIRKRGEVLCGVVLDAAPAEGGSTVDFFQVRTQLGVTWCAHTQVRACSGVDGRCICEATPVACGRQAARSGAASKAPHGNTGVAA